MSYHFLCHNPVPLILQIHNINLITILIHNINLHNINLQINLIDFMCLGDK